MNNLLRQHKNPGPEHLQATKTEEISWSLPANVRCLDNHESMRAEILETSTSQSAADNLLEMRGTPKYLTGRWPSLIYRKFINFPFSASVIPAQKILLLAGLALRPERLSNSTNTSLITLTELRVATEKIKRSSTKQRWLSLRLAHFGWKLVAPSGYVDFKFI
jgi:hypothetical protein